MSVHIVVAATIEESLYGRDVALIHYANVVLRALVHLSLVLLGLLVRHLSLLHVNLPLTLDLLNLLLKLLFLLLQALFFGKSCSASAPCIMLVLNLLLLFGKFGLKAHFFILLGLAHCQASPCHLLRLKFFQVLDLALFLEVLLVSRLFSFLFCLFLLSYGVILQTLLAQVSFLLSDLLDPINSGLLLEAVLKSELIGPRVQDGRLGRLGLHGGRLLHEARRRVRIVASEERTSRLALLLSVSTIDGIHS